MRNPVLVINSSLPSISPKILKCPIIMAIIFTMDVLKSKSSAVIEKKNINPANIGVVISVSKHMVWATLKIAWRRGFTLGNSPSWNVKLINPNKIIQAPTVKAKHAFNLQPQIIFLYFWFLGSEESHHPSEISMKNWRAKITFDILFMIL